MSYFNFIALTTTAIFFHKKWKLSISLFFLGLKELLQGLSYKNIREFKSTKFLTSLSWIHICFQPLFINVLASYFDETFKYWNIVFIVCIIFALYCITILKEFDIQNDKKCESSSNVSGIKQVLNIYTQPSTSSYDFCADDTKSYIGKYHIGYRFNTDIYEHVREIVFLILFCIPLFTKAKIISVGFLSFAIILKIFSYIEKLGAGEYAAMWCFSVTVPALLFAIFNKTVKKYCT